MKDFRKTEDGLFICEECNATFNSQVGLGTHIGITHNTKLYHDKWIKEENEGICKICGKETKFSSKIVTGYYKTCSENCENKNRVNSIKQTLYKNFGVENVFELEEVKQKKKQTYLKHFGVDHNMKNKDSFDKQQISGFNLQYFKNGNLYYRGSYELDFLEKFCEKLTIEKGPAINYVFDKKNRVYHSDFYIPSLNLVVEIKNSYNAEKDKLQIQAKKEATIAKGFNYIMIINKNYDDFTKYILNMK